MTETEDMHMQQIRCPHCGEVFTIDESNYNSIVSQIKNMGPKVMAAKPISPIII